MISRKFANESGSSKTRVEYVFGKGHEHKCDLVEFVGGNVFSSTPDELIEELDTPCHLRKAATGKDSGKCHTHYMLSLAPGESLHAKEWRKILFKTMTALGYTEEHKFFGELHKNTDHQHMHICGNRISMRDYKLLSESNDYEILMQVCREIELEYGLHIVPMPHETFGVNLTREEVEASENTGQVAWKHKLIARVATALERTQERNGNMRDFIKLLNKAEIGVELTTDKSGKPTGISFKFEGKSISGRELKRSRFTWKNLTNREGIHYDESMLQELQKTVRTRNAEPKEQSGPRPTGHPGISSFQYKETGKKVKSSKAFAIVVHTDRLRRTAISRLLEPSYSNGNNLFYVFNNNEKLKRNEVQMKIMNENAIKMSETALRLIEAILSMFRCEIKIEYSPAESEGPLYTLDCQALKHNKTLELSPA
ncbi:relaxase/mobilization nuclease domain-containing protein [Pseudomonas aeruginosa]|uniref:relaxase/mobilization nuclease domain-containing protein n=1 Tax=Pseudomonas aeruginosa TaxID=287 RepID=UPI0022B66A3E|nr:relaxase/mobilization nuclease domain-containing protein [Pseudomonas aeruginosa]MCZ7719923.1 relaxase/mobilization nuclease domain-containing protein [Pseudomonas aeruginosa]MCZ7823873.1 relaxase/mobilization nuclease domain-containing protein [Pseudomonas aeruginosa]